MATSAWNTGNKKKSTIGRNGAIHQIKKREWKAIIKASGSEEGLISGCANVSDGSCLSSPQGGLPEPLEKGATCIF